MTGSVGRWSAGAKAVADRFAAPRVPDALSANWSSPLAAPEGDRAAEKVFRDRLGRDRVAIIPWLQRTRQLRGARLLEVGCGPGASTVALAEQGVRLTSVDLSAEAVSSTRRRCRQYGVAADVEVANAANLADRFSVGEFEWIVFWAVLEHMTVNERLCALRDAWRLLDTGGLLTVIETPNRLWYYDSHTSMLPFFMWLPDELALQVSGMSQRPGFGDRYADLTDGELLHFQRRGRGVSFHEFHAAIGPVTDLDVVSCMQLERRRRSLLRRLGWRSSRAGRYERLLASVSKGVPAAFRQPFLYLTVRRN
jgi:2-polyprenyl-3-methyl-5-hydroxy-6-metoxy-1,4-benzoquinol methylase